MFYSTIQSECARKITVATFLSFFISCFLFFVFSNGIHWCFKKEMKMPCLPNDSCSEPLESEGAMDVFQGQGYRLIDLERFSSTLSQGYVAL